MGRRARRRERTAGSPAAAGGASSFADLGVDLDLDPGEVDHPGDVRVGLRDGHGELTLRTAMSPGTRTEYAALLKGERSSAAAAREDRWHRALEFLFERLVVCWQIAGVTTTGQRELLERLRASTPPERDAIREALRGHLGAHFPGIDAP